MEQRIQRSCDFLIFFSSGDVCLELIIRLSKKATLQKMICFGSNFTCNKILYQTTAFIFFPMCRVFMNYWSLQFTQDISLVFVLPCTCFNFQYPIYFMMSYCGPERHVSLRPCLERTLKSALIRLQMSVLVWDFFVRA